MIRSTCAAVFSFVVATVLVTSPQSTEAKDRRTGALLGVYRHLGEHFKVGVGYNFTDYSDDLTDLSFRNDGWFLNIIGEM